ncbi:MAG: DUF4012 domain-containing protein [Dehalococcoidia bacterium]|nr:DUF4012 domain-containing protein [Dehalococcoidia bacterium]
MNFPTFRRRRAVAYLAVGALIVLAGWHYTTLYREATAARSALLSVEDTVSIGLDAQAEDLDVLDARLAEARTHIDAAQAHLRWDPLLQAGKVLPVAGDQVVAAEGFLDAADHLVAAGDEAIVLARDAIATREDADTGDALTTTALDLLDRAGPALDRIQGHVDAAVAARREIGDRRLVGPLDDARTRLDEQLPRIAELMSQAVVARDVVPGLMGFEGQRRYLVLSLNNAELMPGGGLVTAAGVLTVEDGHVVSTTFRSASAWLPAYAEAGGTALDAPAPLQRHLLKDYPWNLGVSNWDPDFPTWARQSLEMYEMAWGPQHVDGVIAVDLDVLKELLAITGAQTVEAPGFGEVRLTSDNAVMELERVTRAPPDTWRRTKEAVGTLQEALLRDVMALPASRWDDLIRVMRQMGDERHLQVLLFDARAQALVDEVRWNGALLDPAGDYLQVNEASVNSTKLNLVFAPTATYDIEVGPLGDARHRLTLRYDNTVDEWSVGRDPDLVRHLMFDGQYGAYVRAFTPGDATGVTAEVDGRPTAIEDEGTSGALRWSGVYLPVAPGATRELTLQWTVPLATTDPNQYELTLQKQPGTAGLCIDLGVHRDGVDARLEVEGGSTDAQGRTCLTTDVTVHATFE